MKNYHDLLRHVLNEGHVRSDRTGTGTLGVPFAPQLRFDLTKGFPAMTTKKLFWKGVVHELLWMISGNTNIKYLVDNGVHIWDEWADKDGRLGPVYGAQWRKWKKFEILENCSDPYWEHEIDQLANVIDSLKKDPFGRRHIVSAWNPSDLDEMALPPCHMMFQFYVDPNHCKKCRGMGRVGAHDPGCGTVGCCDVVCPDCNGTKVAGKPKLSCQLYQRSADLFLGVPFNIASYSLLTHMIAQICKYDVGEFVHTFGDAHIYLNHIDQVKEQLLRDTEKYPLPTLELDKKIKKIDDFKYEHIKLVGYQSYPTISAPVAV